MRDGHHGETTARIESVRAVLFDLDGTLVDTIGLIRESMRHATREVLGRVIPDAELMQHVGIPLEKQMRVIAPDRVTELTAAYRSHNSEVHDDLICEYPGTRDCLARLAADAVPMGIVTSKSRAVALRGLDLFELRGFFSVIVCSDDVDVHKPDPFPLTVAARELAVPIEHCAYVGDSPFDMQAAIAGGTVSIAALWGAFSAEEVLAPGPDLALSSISDLPQAIKRPTEFVVDVGLGSGSGFSDADVEESI